jgi:hypothetical protein
VPSVAVTHLRRRTLVALVAAWSLALLPALSQALAAVTGERAWAEVCTAQGARWVPVDDGAPTDAGRAAPACAWCVASAHGPALLPRPAAWVAPALAHVPPCAPAATSAVSTAWVHPHPRGPPSRTV